MRDRARHRVARPDVQFHLRAGARGAGLAIGPGKVALLEAIASTGSISAAARTLGMSYRRAWMLVDETNRCLAAPAVSTAAGGPRGGGTRLSAVGAEFVRRYRALERRAAAAVTAQLGNLLAGAPARDAAVQRKGGKKR
ncbi:MAG: ModE family transcriptional regulator [Betaproteobacteria bacterium]